VAVEVIYALVGNLSAGAPSKAMSSFANSDVLSGELSVGVAAIATALVGASFLFTRADQVSRLSESLEKDDAVKRLNRLKVFPIGLLIAGTILCLISIIAMIKPVFVLGLISFIATSSVLAVGLELGRRLTR
jgi:hypothetical protein